MAVVCLLCRWKKKILLSADVQRDQTEAANGVAVSLTSAKCGVNKNVQLDDTDRSVADSRRNASKTPTSLFWPRV